MAQYMELNHSKIIFKSYSLNLKDLLINFKLESNDIV